MELASASMARAMVRVEVRKVVKVDDEHTPLGSFLVPNVSTTVELYCSSYCSTLDSHAQIYVLCRFKNVKDWIAS